MPPAARVRPSRAGVRAECVPPVGRRPGERLVMRTGEAAATRPGTRSGSRAPRPRPPSASTVPPAWVTMCLTIASPSPVPREARARSARKNRSKRRVSCASSTPTPSSVPRSDDRVAVALDGEREGRAGARVADRVLGEVLGDHADHPRPDRELDRRVALDDSATPARLARSSSSATTASSSCRTGTAPSETTRVPDSSSLRNRTSSISSLICSTSPRARSTRSAHVLAGERRGLEQRQQPGERRPQLVRDGRREAGAQLLVGGRGRRPLEVDEPLAPARRRRRARRAG